MKNIRGIGAVVAADLICDDTSLRVGFEVYQKAVELGIPTVIFSPLGTSFTTNTVHMADKPGCVVYSTNDFSQPAYGMKMLKAGTRMKRTRCVVIKGDERIETTLADTEITLQYVPANTFIDIYNNMPVSDEIITMTDQSGSVKYLPG